MIKKVHDLNIQIYADGAEKDGMLELAQKPYIKGFTTNPTLMRKAGVTDYVKFAKEIVAAIPDKPISFEVFSDDFKEMERQAKIIASWGKNVYVKIPITNTKRESAVPLIAKLVAQGIKVNATAILTVKQVEQVAKVLSKNVPSIVSVFAGRIADTGHNPVHYMKKAKQILASNPKAELLWASPRELWNIYQAAKVGCHIVTVPHDILKKSEKIGYDLDELSLDTVKMFYDDGQKVGYTLYES
ncbi:MAG: transaldolase [Patescibacteria group bacterium]